MAKYKFYAIKIGRKVGIVNNWPECKESTHGFSKAEFQGFETIEEANEYLGITKKAEAKAKKAINNKKEKKKINENNKVSNEKNSIKAIRSKANVEVLESYVDCEELKNKYDFIAFVDGSYDKVSKTYGSGVVVLNLENNEYKLYSSAGYDKWNQWNIVGEIEATKLALKIAKEEYNSKNIAIYHDLKNISLWASGEWQAKNEYTQEYVKVIERFSKEINICFIKVKAHSNESIYNDLADETAKKAIEEYKSNNGYKTNNKINKDKIVINIPNELKSKFLNECDRLNISYDEAINNLIKEWIN